MAHTKYLADIAKDEYWKKGKIPTEHYAPFSMIGRLRTMNYTKNSDPDIFDKMAKMSKSAIILFNELKLVLNPSTNFATYSTEGMTRSEKTMFARYIKELKEEDLVVEARTADITDPVPPSTYMINPYMVKCIKYERAKEVWAILKQEAS